MLQFKGPHEAEDLQGHLGNVDGVPIAVPHGQTAGHHVGIPNRFYLWKERLLSGSSPLTGMDTGQRQSVQLRMRVATYTFYRRMLISVVFF